MLPISIIWTVKKNIMELKKRQTGNFEKNGSFQLTNSFIHSYIIIFRNVTVKEKKPVTQMVPNDQNQTYKNIYFSGFPYHFT